MKKPLFFAISTDRVDKKPPYSPNKRVTFDDLRQLITCGNPPKSYARLPDLALRAYRDGDQAAKDELSELKKELPYFLASGFCPQHHVDAALEYNRALQIDIDFKTPDGQKRAVALLEKIKTLRPAGVLFATLSPSTFGVKILLATDNQNKEKHGAALSVAIAYLSDLLQVCRGNFDKLGASQPVYVPFERTPGQSFFNSEAGIFSVTFPDVRTDQSGGVEYAPEIVRAAAQYLIEKQIDVANERADYVSLTAACKNAFGDDGLQVARDILQSSAAFRSSNFTRRIEKVFRGLRRSSGKMATGGTLVHLARKNGFKATTDRNWRTLTAEPGEYLTDALSRHDVPLVDVVGKYIIAPTGSGKTHLVGEFVRQNPNRRVILVVPTRALVRRIVNREKENAAVGFIGGERQITGDEKFIVVTVHSFCALATRINLTEFDVFFDEAHALTSDTSKPYKQDVLRRFYGLAKSTAFSLTWLTGTPLYNFHPDFEKVERLVVRADQRISKRAEFLDVENILATVCEGVRRSIAKGRFPVVLMNDKSLRLAALKTALADIHLAILNSDAKDGEHFKQISETGGIPADVQVIITTSVLKEGSDIYDDRAFDFFIVGAFHSSSIEQMTARPRNAKEVVAYIVKSVNRKKDNKNFNPAQYARLVENEAQEFCDEHNAQEADDDTTAIFWEKKTRLAIQDQPVVEQNGKMQVCHFALNNEVFQVETSVEYRNNDYQATNLRKYGFAVSTTCGTLRSDCQPQHSPETAAAVKVARQDCKASKKKAHQDAINALASSPFPLVIVADAERENRAPGVFLWFKKLIVEYGMTTTAAGAHLRDIDTGKKFADLENRLRVYLLRNDTRYMKSGRIFSLVIGKLYKDLRPGQKYTADELRAKLQFVLRLDRSINLEKIDYRRATKIARMFFEVRQSGQKTTSDCTRKLVFTLNNLTEFRVQEFFPKHTLSTCYALEPDFARVLVETCPF